VSTTPGFKFKEMPGLGLYSSDLDDFIDKNHNYFVGEPNFNPKGATEEEEAAVEEAEPEQEEEEGQQKGKDSDESEEEEIKVPKRTLLEIHRVAFCVNAIENDCQICPTGAFKLTAEHQLRRNESFCGLNKSEADKIDCYQHFRNVQQEDKKAFLGKNDAPFSKDILDPICND